VSLVALHNSYFYIFGGLGKNSLTEVIDTTSPAGRMMMQLVGTFAEFERAMLRERTQIGLDAARKQGRLGGRRSKLKVNQQEEIVHLVKSGEKTAADVARLFKGYIYFKEPPYHFHVQFW
jgi:DNA invertase Pin-like site-specific DNA recombinase